MSRVSHLMTPSPATIRDTATAVEAAAAMQRLGLRHLPVVDAGGKLVGMLSDRDLRGPMIGTAHDRPALEPTTPVATLMTRDVVTATPSDELGQVARRIIEHRIGAVPIVDAAGIPQGIISYVDVLRRLADDADADAHAVELMDR
ncbi:MAG TPA: CBS domain-containing protein [Kofleriaceae bacterium]|nr:CBS domain-containing protein [Kofleriaceae bacterium]